MRTSLNNVMSLILYKNAEGGTYRNVWDISKHQMLGNRRDYYYEYVLYKHGKEVLRTESLKKVYEYLRND